MSALPWLLNWVVPLFAAVAAILSLLCLRDISWPMQRAPVVARVLPWPLRACWLPARSLAVLLGKTVPAQHLRRIQAELARCDLDAVLDAPLWLGLRVVVLGVLLTGTSLLAVFMHWPVMPPTLLVGGLSWLMTGRWLHKLRVARENKILKELPASLDVLTLCVEAGATLTAALRMVVEKSPETALRGVFERILREVRAGRTRLEALEHVAGIYRLDCLYALVGALLHSEGSGVSLGSLLRAQAEQRSAERHLRAERLALQAPVKMLGPLVLCIFPCTFVVISVPIVARVLQVTTP